jgi:hypothetical protein
MNRSFAIGKGVEAHGLVIGIEPQRAATDSANQ